VTEEAVVAAKAIYIQRKINDRAESFKESNLIFRVCSNCQSIYVRNYSDFVESTIFEDFRNAYKQDHPGCKPTVVHADTVDDAKPAMIPTTRENVEESTENSTSAV